jgi:hypothetical protein
MEWLSHFVSPLMQVYVIHGERNVSESFANAVRERFHFATHAPELGEVLKLAATAEPEMIAEVSAQPAWQMNLVKIIQKAEEIRNLWEKSPQSITPQVQESLARELAQVENMMIKIIQKASE